MADFDTRPGGLDGPPAPTTSERVGRATGACMLLLVIMLLATAMAWVIAWMIVHFPTS